MKQSKVILSVLTALSLITACQSVSQNTGTLPSHFSLQNPLLGVVGLGSSHLSATTIRGTAEFPDSLSAHSGGRGMSTLATLSDIASNATVSLIYSSDYSNIALRNVTIATGLTNASGQFTINPDSSFAPQTGSVYILEAIKRISGNNMAIRTFLQWNGGKWDSITTPDIFVNTKTTALTIIVNSNPSVLTSAGTINKMPVVNGVSTLQDINTNVTANVIDNLRDMTDYLLQNNRDPIGFIKYDASNTSYVINNRAPVTPAPAPILQTSGNIYTIAGLTYKGDGGLASDAFVWRAIGVFVDNNGNIFIADTQNNRIRKIDKATGIITTVAGDGYSDSNGNGRYAGDGGQATSASLSKPSGVFVDNNGNIFIADTQNNRIRKVDKITGIISTIVDNVPSSAVFLDSAGNIFSINATNDVTKTDPVTGITSTIATTNSGGGVGQGLFVDANGNVFFTDSNTVIKKLDKATGIVTTVAGNGIYGFSGDGGLATSASLSYPSGVYVDSNENIFILDAWNGRIRKVDGSSGIITSLKPILSQPGGFYPDSNGNFFIADTGNSKIKKYNQVTRVTYDITSATNGDGELAVNASLSDPRRFYIDSIGNMFIADANNNRIRKIDKISGIITTVAGNGNLGSDGDGGQATSASLNRPGAIVTDSNGNMFIADSYNNKIRKVDKSTGIISTVAGNGTGPYSGDGSLAINATIYSPYELCLDNSENILITDTNNSRIRKIDKTTGIISTIAGNGTAGYSGDGDLATNTSINKPYGLSVDDAGNIYIADSSNYRIRKVDTITGVISTVAGTGTSGFSGDGGLATSANIGRPYGVDVDNSGNIFIADNGNGRIRKVDAATGIITTIAGNATQGINGEGVPATTVSLNGQYGVFVDDIGNVYISDTKNNRIRKVVK